MPSTVRMEIFIAREEFDCVVWGRWQRKYVSFPDPPALVLEHPGPIDWNSHI